MPRFLSSLLLTFVAGSSLMAQASVPQPALAKELIAMARVDQAARIKAFGIKDEKLRLPAFKTMSEIDARNLVRMRQIVDRYGWPGRKLVGDVAAGDAWLLVQHADTDKPFQRKCLQLILPLMDTGEVQRSDVALLIDRVLVGEGKHQLYGSQWKFTPDGDMKPDPIADPVTVDARRKAMNLLPMAEYERMMRKVYTNMLKKKS